MSKQFTAAIFALPLILQIFNNCAAQDAVVTISIRSLDPPIAEIRGRYAESSVQKNFSLTRDFGGFMGLAERVSDIRLEDRWGKPVVFRQFIPGEYVAEKDYIDWTYKIDLAPPKSPAAAAHVSWLGSENGLLFLRDLLPLGPSKNCQALKVSVQAPDGWTVSGNELTADPCPDKRVLFLSKGSRRLSVDTKTPIDVVLQGDWKFSDQQAADFTKEIFSAYVDLFGSSPKGKNHVYILPFPITVGPGNWEADTRGNSVVVLSSDMPFGTQSIQRLHEQLRHELFHLWMPNGVHLSGHYDWFYEGFALYESLKLGVASNRLRFDDLLDTLGRAMTIDAALTGSFSLIAASNARASGGDTGLYARGMLIAFLTDLKALRGSNGKRSIDDLLRAIFEKYQDRKNEADGNQAVLAAIGDTQIERYVKTGEPITWAAELSSAGIERVERPGSTVLQVLAKPNGAQKKLLDKLGYNNWRKSSVGPK